MLTLLETLIKELSPATQSILALSICILALSIFAAVLLIATSRSATRNFCEVLAALVRLLRRKSNSS